MLVRSTSYRFWLTLGSLPRGSTPLVPRCVSGSGSTSNKVVGVDEPEGVPIDEGLNEVDANTERPIDRIIGSMPGSVAGAGMTGLAKGMGMWVEPQEAAVIREVGEPPPDPDDPIQVTIDPDHPENTRIVYHVRAQPPDEPSVI